MATNREARARIERDERKRARDEIRSAVVAHRVAKQALAEHVRQTSIARREKDRELARDLKALRAAFAQSPRDARLALAAARAEYREWWRGVLLERQRRMDEIQAAREDLQYLRENIPALLQRAIRERIETESLLRDRLDRQASSTESRLAADVRATDRERTATRMQHRTGSGILRGSSRSRSQAARDVREAREEFDSIVESNLPPTLVAWFRSNRAKYAKPGRSPDRVAEMVVEDVEEQSDEFSRIQGDEADRKAERMIRESGMQL